MTALTVYYSTILGSEVDTSWEFDLDHLYDGHQRAEQGPLLAPFLDEEAWSAVRAMCADSAPGPDGVGPGFYASSGRSMMNRLTYNASTARSSC